MHINEKSFYELFMPLDHLVDGIVNYMLKADAIIYSEGNKNTPIRVWETNVKRTSIYCVGYIYKNVMYKYGQKVYFEDHLTHRLNPGKIEGFYFLHPVNESSEPFKIIINNREFSPQSVYIDLDTAQILEKELAALEDKKHELVTRLYEILEANAFSRILNHEEHKQLVQELRDIEERIEYKRCKWTDEIHKRSQQKDVDKRA